MAKSTWTKQAFGDRATMYLKRIRKCEASVHPNLYDGLPWYWIVGVGASTWAKGDTDTAGEAKRKAAAALRACAKRYL